MKIIFLVCITAVMIHIATSHAGVAGRKRLPTRAATASTKAKEKESLIVMWEGWATGYGYTADVRRYNLTLEEAQATQKVGLLPEDKLVSRRTQPLPLDVYYCPRVEASSETTRERNIVIVTYDIDPATGRVTDVNLGRESENWNVEDINASKFPSLPNFADRNDWEYRAAADGKKDEGLCIPADSKP